MATSKKDIREQRSLAKQVIIKAEETKTTFQTILKEKKYASGNAESFRSEWQNIYLLKKNIVNMVECLKAIDAINETPISLQTF